MSNEEFGKRRDLVPAADSTSNVEVKEVVGNKTDTANPTVGVTSSLMRYIKALMTLLGYHPVTGVNSADNVVMRDVIGNKSDTIAGTSLMALNRVQTADVATNTNERDVVGNKSDAAVIVVAVTKSLMAYVKGILTRVTGTQWAMQADSTLAQAAPAQNTWYDILTAANGVNVRIHSVAINIQTTGETLEARFIVDGQTWTVAAGVACAAGTEYYVRRSATAGTSTTGVTTIGTTEVTPVLTGFMECKSCQISVRKTTAAGTGTLRGRVIWEKAS